MGVPKILSERGQRPLMLLHWLYNQKLHYTLYNNIIWYQWAKHLHQWAKNVFTTTVTEISIKVTTAEQLKRANFVINFKEWGLGYSEYIQSAISWQFSKNKCQMYYWLGTCAHYCIGAQQTLRLCSPDGSTFLCEMTSSRHHLEIMMSSKIQLHQSMHIYLKANLIWNDGALSIFWRWSHNNNNKNKKSSNMRSVHNLKRQW